MYSKPCGNHNVVIKVNMFRNGMEAQKEFVSVQSSFIIQDHSRFYLESV